MSQTTSESVEEWTSTLERFFHHITTSAVEFLEEIRGESGGLRTGDVRPEIAGFLLERFFALYLDNVRVKEASEQENLLRLFRTSASLALSLYQSQSDQVENKPLWDSPLSAESTSVIHTMLHTLESLVESYSPSILEAALHLSTRALQLINISQEVERLRRVGKASHIEDVYLRAHKGGLSLATIDSALSIYTTTAHPNRAVVVQTQAVCDTIAHTLVAHLHDEPLPSPPELPAVSLVLSSEVQSTIDQLLLNLLDQPLRSFHPITPEQESRYVTDLVATQITEGDRLFFHEHWESRQKIFEDPSPPIRCAEFHSWLSSDMDGRPGMSAAASHRTFHERRAAIVDSYVAHIDELVPYAHVRTDDGAFFSDQLLSLKEKLILSQDFWHGEPYATEAFIEDIDTLVTSLSAIPNINRRSILRDGIYELRYLSRGRGLFLQKSEFRENTGVIEKALTEAWDLVKKKPPLFTSSRLYRELDEDERNLVTGLLIENAEYRADILNRVDPSKKNLFRLLEVLATAKSALERDSLCTHSFIISLFERPSNYLELLALMKIGGLNNKKTLRLPITPLSETPEDLHKAPHTARSLFQHPIASRAIHELFDSHIVWMFGYSDGGMRAGFCSREQIRESEDAIIDLGKEFEIKVLSEHGRGPRPGRGGGRFANTVFTSRRSLETGYTHATIQGDGIEDVFGHPFAARRSFNVAFSNYVNGLLTIRSSAEHSKWNEWITLRKEAYRRGRVLYGDLIGRPLTYEGSIVACNSSNDILDSLQLLMPVTDIANFNTASRPVFRSSNNGEVIFELFRAVPNNILSDGTRLGWVGFYGMGTALSHMKQTNESLLRTMLAVDKDFASDIESLLLSLQRMSVPLVSVMVRFLYPSSSGDSRVERCLTFLEKVETEYFLLTKTLCDLFPTRQSIPALRTLTAVREIRGLKDPIATLLQGVQLTLTAKRAGWPSRPSALSDHLKHHLAILSTIGLLRAVGSTG